VAVEAVKLIDHEEFQKEMTSQSSPMLSPYILDLNPTL
jgi:hypothetical protein